MTVTAGPPGETPGVSVRTKRIYDEPAASDGTRVLVDRLWPRGVSKESAELDAWLREVAPSDDLRRWYDHDPEKWPEFTDRYEAELDERPGAVDELLEYAREGPVTLLYASRETEYNNAVALKAVLERRLSGDAPEE